MKNLFIIFFTFFFFESFAQLPKWSLATTSTLDFNLSECNKSTDAGFSLGVDGNYRIKDRVVLTGGLHYSRRNFMPSQVLWEEGNMNFISYSSNGFDGVFTASFTDEDGVTTTRELTPTTMHTHLNTLEIPLGIRFYFKRKAKVNPFFSTGITNSFTLGGTKFSYPTGDKKLTTPKSKVKGPKYYGAGLDLSFGLAINITPQSQLVIAPYARMLEMRMLTPTDIPSESDRLPRLPNYGLDYANFIGKYGLRVGFQWSL